MALLDIKTTKRITITCSLEEEIAVQVDQYAAFLKVPADDVVNKALEYVFSKDREFQQYREQHADAPAASSLRVKKPAAAQKKAKSERREMLAIAK